MNRRRGQPPGRGGAGGRAVKAEDQAHGGGLADAIGAEEPGDPAQLDGAHETVDGPGAAVVLKERFIPLGVFDAFVGGRMGWDC